MSEDGGFVILFPNSFAVLVSPSQVRAINVYGKRICSDSTLILNLGVLLGAFCLSLSITWFIFRHSSWAWILQDIIGFFFCIFTISELHLPNFKLLTLLLIGFCVYDVFMVYITPYLTPKGDSIMVSVATGG